MTIPPEKSPRLVCILAAGTGSRLGDATKNLPKSLLDVSGKSLLDRQLGALEQSGVPREEIRIVTGHAAHVIEEHYGERYGLIHNPLYAKYNNIYTVHLLSQYVDEELLLINGDDLFEAGILASLLASDADAALVIDDAKPLAEEEMKVRFKDNRLVEIGKTLEPETSYGEYIGLLRFRGAALATYFAALAKMIDDGGTDGWYENALNLIVDDVAIRAVSTEGRPWVEVDTPEDLAAAQTLAVKLDGLAVR